MNPALVKDVQDALARHRLMLDEAMTEYQHFLTAAQSFDWEAAAGAKARFLKLNEAAMALYVEACKKLEGVRLG